MADQFSRGNYERLAITHNTAAKYYTLLTLDELATATDRMTEGGHQLVLLCTERELRSITASNQIDLFRKAPDVPN